MAGSYSRSALNNYLAGIRAWHIIHGVRWLINDNEANLILKAAVPLTPAASKRPKRKPYTTEYITDILCHIDPSTHLGAAVQACLTTCFYTAARVNEFTLPNLKAFDPKLHVKRADIQIEVDHEGLQQTTFFIPHTKTAAQGEDVYWAKQLGPTDPDIALANHFTINNPPILGPLFAYKSGCTLRPLTKHKFLKTLHNAAISAGHTPCKGHGIRIGATLEYLLRKLPFDVVKAKGRWAGDSFSLYLRKHAQIMAPYMQAVPEVHDQVLRLSMPPVR